MLNLRRDVVTKTTRSSNLMARMGCVLLDYAGSITLVRLRCRFFFFFFVLCAPSGDASEWCWGVLPPQPRTAFRGLLTWFVVVTVSRSFSPRLRCDSRQTSETMLGDTSAVVLRVVYVAGLAVPRFACFHFVSDRLPLLLSWLLVYCWLAFFIVGLPVRFALSW